MYTKKTNLALVTLITQPKVKKYPSTSSPSKSGSIAPKSIAQVASARVKRYDTSGSSWWRETSTRARAGVDLVSNFADPGFLSTLPLQIFFNRLIFVCDTKHVCTHVNFSS